jgi:hypothetical protein
VGTHRRRRGPGGRAHEVLLGRRVAEQLEQAAGRAPAEDQRPGRRGVGCGGLGERVRAGLRPKVEHDVGRRGVARATGAGGHWQSPRSSARVAPRCARGGPAYHRAPPGGAHPGGGPSRRAPSVAPPQRGAARHHRIPVAARPAGHEGALRGGPQYSSGDLPPPPAAPIVPWRVAPPHHMLTTDNRIGEDPCPRKGTPVARRGRKATGLSESAGLPNGGGIACFGMGSAGSQNGHRSSPPLDPNPVAVTGIGWPPA